MTRPACSQKAICPAIPDCEIIVASSFCNWTSVRQVEFATTWLIDTNELPDVGQSLAGKSWPAAVGAAELACRAGLDAGVDATAAVNRRVLGAP